MSTRRRVYMDYASMGRPAPTTIQAVQRAVSEMDGNRGSGTELTVGLLKEVEEAREAVSRLLTAPSESIALIENTTQGLGLLAASMPLKPGDNVVVPDIDFLSAVLVWRRMAEVSEIEVRAAETRGGRVATEDFARAMDSRTRVVVTSAVQEVSGYRVDLESLMDLCLANGSYLIVDGIQEAGVLERDLSHSPAHAYCAGGHKWLGSPFGLGFMYVHADLLEACSPLFYGYLNLHEPEKGWGAYLESRERSPFDELSPWQSARSFESGGMPNWLGATGLRWAVEDILQRGIASSESHVLSLGCYLKDGLERLGLEPYVLGGGGDDHLSAILTFGLPGGFPQEKALLKSLEEEDVLVSLRSTVGIGGIRVSPYVDNTLEDIASILEITERHLKEV